MRTELLKEIRDQKKITLEQLSGDVDISVSQLSRFEAGKRFPRVHELERIALRLGVDAWIFLDKQPPKAKVINEGIKPSLAREALLVALSMLGMNDIATQTVAASLLEEMSDPIPRRSGPREEEIAIAAESIIRQALRKSAV
ncbi:MAG: helix-turn-helix transcriptional regulator [Beijerinckiaceae bacterium]|nr:helix-turn-helix transcriptional regulator [Beijerinckiaceae bacterium]